MKLVVVGISHKTASLEVREKFFLTVCEQEDLLKRLKSSKLVTEAIVLSTCNRTEIYANLAEENNAESQLIDHIFEIKGVSKTPSLYTYFYAQYDDQCLLHLLKVSSGLDSLVLGEKQILGQLKKTVELSRRNKMLSKGFNLITNLAIRAGKKAQSETNICYGGASVSWAAVKLAEVRLGGLNGKSALIVGAGKMSKLAASHIKNKNLKNIYVINRTMDKAKVLTDEIGGEARSFLRLSQTLCEVDLCIVSSSAPYYLLNETLMEKVARKRKQNALLCIDISTPRNIDPKVNNIKNLTVCTMDDLNKVVDGSMCRRKDSILDVEYIIAVKMNEYKRKMNKIHNYADRRLLRETDRCLQLY